MKNAIFFLALATSASSFAAVSDFTGQQVLVKGFPDMVKSRCLRLGSCDLSKVDNEGKYGLSGNETLTVIEDKGQTLLVLEDDINGKIVGEVDRSSIVLRGPDRK